MKLTLINHACCKIETAAGAVLFDPWVEGAVFNLGWDLLIPTSLDFEQIMAGVRFIWLSHEHPDHFSIPFLSRVAKTKREQVTVLFQRTRDRRVANFCRSLGLDLQELEVEARTRLAEGLEIVCGTHDLYDSWLALSDGTHTILNINDCPMGETRDLKRVRRLVPRPTVLLSQFSYAAWKGGRENRAYRALAARQKLEILARQIAILKPRFVIPFASFIYFSKVENAFLNAAVNTPADAARTIEEAGALPVILYPGDAWEVDSRAPDNAAPLARYRHRYAELDRLPKREPGVSATLEELSVAFRAYQQKIFAKNSRSMIWMLSRVPGLGAFRPVMIGLRDIDATVSVSLFSGFVVLGQAAETADVTMHSSSLLFVFRNEFGYDTLTVNGRFDASVEGFAKLTRTFGVGSLNAMGLAISPRLLFSARVVLMRLRRLRAVRAQLGRKNTPASS